jgi:murein DD-endopeptidase MepM/ murein hydrolase activator NlpD
LIKSPRTRWSLVIIRGPAKHAKHFQVSKRFLIAVPTALLLIVTSSFVMLQLRSDLVVGKLEQRIEDQSHAHAAAINRKEGQIRQLEDQVGMLSRYSEEMKAQLQDLYALESKLKHFIDTYGLDGAAEDGSSGGEAMLRALDGDVPDYEQLSGMIDSMTLSMEYALEQARQHKAAADAVPSGWPTSSRKLTSGFGYRSDPFTGRSVFHAGIDLAGRTGDPVYAAGDGTVEEQGFDRSRGNYIVLNHRNGLKSVYMHLKRADVEEGDDVARGETIGSLGSTGRSTGPHLHFEIMLDDETVNPTRYLRLIKED